MTQGSDTPDSVLPDVEMSVVRVTASVPKLSGNDASGFDDRSEPSSHTSSEKNDPKSNALPPGASTPTPLTASPAPEASHPACEALPSKSPLEYEVWSNATEPEP